MREKAINVYIKIATTDTIEQCEWGREVVVM
jgi:hypothetical protein